MIQGVEDIGRWEGRWDVDPLQHLVDLGVYPTKRHCVFGFAGVIFDLACWPKGLGRNELIATMRKAEVGRIALSAKADSPILLQKLQTFPPGLTRICYHLDDH